jgi:hypothetical protein
MIFGNGLRHPGIQRKSLLVALGVVAIPLSLQLHGEAADAKVKSAPASNDPRVTLLHRFLKKLACPVAPMAEDFVRVADANHLDWRLLPSIAVIESGGGKAYKNNNIFGWNKGDQVFASIRSGLELVADRLAHSPLYKWHDSLGKLHIYNENEEYAGWVIAVMPRLDERVHGEGLVEEGESIQF